MDRQIVLNEAGKELSKLIGSKFVANKDESFINPDITMFDRDEYNEIRLYLEQEFEIGELINDGVIDQINI